MPLDYDDPEKIKLIAEKTEHETLKCMNWYLKHKEEIRAQITEKHKHFTHESIAKRKIELEMPALSKHYAISGMNRRRKVASDETLNFFTKSELSGHPIMKPPELSESSILYKYGGGGAAYLNMRKYKKPEQKYNSCETSNVYGWRLKDSALKYGASEYSRYFSFFKETRRFSGAHQDPRHYIMPKPFIYKKCSEFE